MFQTNFQLFLRSIKKYKEDVELKLNQTNFIYLKPIFNSFKINMNINKEVFQFKEKREANSHIKN